MDAPDTFTVLIEGTKVTVPAKFAQASAYINSIMALGFEEDEEIVVDRLSKSTFDEVLQFYALCEYQDVPIKTPIETNDLESVMSPKFAQFISRHALNSEQFKALYRGVEFLGCKSLFRVIAARFACYLYFEDSKEAFEAKQKELGVEVKVEFEDNEKFKKLYPFMNN